MRPFVKVGIVAALVVAVGLVLAFQQERPESAVPASQVGLPQLLELGSVNCIPCRMMAPILEELRQEYEGRLQVEFIDVNQDRSAGEAYGIRVIPTQIFFDASGQERFRHEGFMPKEDILAKWKELGVDLSPDP